MNISVFSWRLSVCRGKLLKGIKWQWIGKSIKGNFLFNLNSVCAVVSIKRNTLIMLGRYAWIVRFSFFVKLSLEL